MKRYNVYVERSVLVTQRWAYTCADEADLKQQLEKAEVALKDQPFVAKIERDKSGKVVFTQLSKDWEIDETATEESRFASNAAYIIAEEEAKIEEQARIALAEEQSRSIQAARPAKVTQYQTPGNQPASSAWLWYNDRRFNTPAGRAYLAELAAKKEVAA